MSESPTGVTCQGSSVWGSGVWGSGEIQPRQQYQWNPLHIVAERGNLELSKYISEKTGWKNPQRSDGLTAYHLAAQNGHLEVIPEVIFEFLTKL